MNEVIIAFLASPEVQASISTILLTVVTGIVTVASRTIFGWLKANTSTKQFELLQEIAAVAVRASEQGAIGGFVTDRKATAINIVNEQLKASGVKNISAEQIEAAIEAAVIAAATEFTDAAVARSVTSPVLIVEDEAPAEDDLPGDGADTV